jgi:hypothetical protein
MRLNYLSGPQPRVSRAIQHGWPKEILLCAVRCTGSGKLALVCLYGAHVWK